MLEQILKHRPKGATHWQAGYYYNSDECGIWSIWENGKWHGDFKFPDGVMTKLPEEKEPAMSEFKKGDILVNKTAVNTGTIELIYEQKYYFHGLSKDFGIITISKKKLDRYRKATKTEEEAGHRIDNDMGDDFPIENHISPNCKVEDV